MKINRTVNSLLILVFCIHGIVVFAYLLRRNLHPWELELLIPSGVSEMAYHGRGMGAPGLHRYVDLSDDEKRLLVSRPNGTCEIWDLESKQKIREVGTPLSKGQDAASLPFRPILLPDGESVFRDVGYTGTTFEVIDAAGRVTPLPLPSIYGLAAVSPDGRLVASVDRSVCEVRDLSTGSLLLSTPLEHASGNSARLQWSRDGRYLLFNDFLGVRVWDMERRSFTFFHRELDLHLPSPMIANKNTGLAMVDRRGEERDAEYAKSVAVLVDSQIEPGATFIASLYQGYEAGIWMTRDDSALTNRIRFYDIASGELLWDEVLGMQARGMAFSKDGSLLFVSEAPNFSSHIKVFDTKARRLARELKFHLVNRYPTEISPTPDNRWLAVYSNKLWLVDILEVVPPIAFDGSPNVTHVEFTSDGQRMIEVGMEKTVRIWRNRHPITCLGSLGRIEGVMIYVLAFAAVLSLLLLAGRSKEIAIGNPFPRGLWWVALILGVVWAESFSTAVINYASGPVYAPEKVPEWTTFSLGMAAKLFGLITILMVLRLRQRWRVFMLVLLGLGIALQVFAVGALTVVWFLGRLPNEMMMPGVAAGVSLKFPPAAIIGWNLATALLLIWVFWLLKTLPRQLFSPQPVRPWYQDQIQK